MAEELDHPGTFLAYCFRNTVNSDILHISHTAFHLLYRNMNI